MKTFKIKFLILSIVAVATLCRDATAQFQSYGKDTTLTFLSNGESDSVLTTNLGPGRSSIVSVESINIVPAPGVTADTALTVMAMNQGNGATAVLVQTGFFPTNIVRSFSMVERGGAAIPSPAGVTQASKYVFFVCNQPTSIGSNPPAPATIFRSPSYIIVLTLRLVTTTLTNF